jgi:ribonucleoside-diphosphate reductase alpha chain
MPADTTPEDIAEAYLWGWKLGLKALAIYRDGSKQSQPLNTKTEEVKEQDKPKEAARPRRERLPDTRQSVTHKFNVAGHEGYITVGLYPDGRPGELFITMAKEGSTVGGLMDCFGTAISMSLQYGVPLEVLVNKFSHTRFDPMGLTTNPEVRMAKSVVDYIFRWLAIQFIPGYREASGLPAKEPPEEDGEKTVPKPAATRAGGQTGQGSSGREKAARPPSADPAAAGAPRGKGRSSSNGNGHSPGNGRSKSAASVKSQAVASAAVNAALLEAAGARINLEAEGNSPAVRSEQFARFQSDAPSCDNCGAIAVRNGNCYLCHNCGNSMGCS